MNVYKRPWYGPIFDSVLYLVGAGVVWLMLYWTNTGLSIGGWVVPKVPIIVADILAGLVLLAAAHRIFFGDRYQFEIEGSNLRFIQGKETKHDIDLTQYAGGYEMRTRGSDMERCTLTLSPIAGGEDIVIECNALGQNTFFKMWANIEQHIYKEDNTLETRNA